VFAFAAAIASLLALAAYSYLTARRSIASAQAVLRTEEALSQLNLLRADDADAQSASRAYTITRDAGYLDTLRAVLARSAGDVTTVRQLTADDTLQRRALDQIELLMTENAAVQLPAATNVTRTDDLRRRLQAMSDEQRGLLAARTIRAAADTESAAVARRVVFAASLGLLLTSFWVLSRALTRKRLEEQRETFFQVSIDMLVFAGFDGYFKRLNPAWERTLGYTVEELMSKPQIEFVHPDDREATRRQAAAVLAGGSAVAFENRYRCKDGSYKWLLWNSVPSREQQTIYAVARDLTERKQMEAQLRELSLRDDMTSLRNRRGFLLLAEQELKLVRDRRHDGPAIHLWLIFADLDGLKRINDQLGHDVGSQAIVQAASLLKKTFRDADVIARMGGDEFAILAITNEPDGGDTMAARVKEVLRRFNIDEQLPYHLSLSLGVVKVDANRVASIEEVLKEADRQMYEHKRSDKRDMTPT
jgi:diguanylate cyclase (GGDEF)-like protein/PAS domain S-box-containing protein